MLKPNQAHTLAEIYKNANFENFCFLKDTILKPRRPFVSYIDLRSMVILVAISFARVLAFIETRLKHPISKVISALCISSAHGDWSRKPLGLKSKSCNRGEETSIITR